MHWEALSHTKHCNSPNLNILTPPKFSSWLRHWSKGEFSLSAANFPKISRFDDIKTNLIYLWMFWKREKSPEQVVLIFVTFHVSLDFSSYLPLSDSSSQQLAWCFRGFEILGFYTPVTASENEHGFDICYFYSSSVLRYISVTQLWLVQRFLDHPPILQAKVDLWNRRG